MVGKVNKADSCPSFGINIVYDAEYIRIIRKLQQYGLRPSGSKSTDIRRLHEIELREAKKENCVTTKFLTVSVSEQEKIQDKKKEKRKETNPELTQQMLKGQEILAQQMMIAHNIKPLKND